MTELSSYVIETLWEDENLFCPGVCRIVSHRRAWRRHPPRQDRRWRASHASSKRIHCATNWIPRGRLGPSRWNSTKGGRYFLWRIPAVRHVRAFMRDLRARQCCPAKRRTNLAS